MKGKRFLGIIGILVALATVLAGCSAIPASAESGTLRISITDAPPDLGIKEVNLTVTSLKIHVATGVSQTTTEATTETTTTETTTATTTTETESNDGWKELALKGDTGEGVTFNLLDYQSGLQLLLVDEALPAGKYTQIRMEVEKVEVILIGEDSAPKDAKLPSNMLKFVHPFEIIDGGVTEILFDFDALKSIHQTGKGEYMCKPVIKITSVHPVLEFDTGLTSDSAKLPGTLAAGYTITTGRVVNTMHALGLIDTVATPALENGDYAFTLQATEDQKTSLSDYFDAKGWSAEWNDQIKAEINGTEPFFYLNAAEGDDYSLVDGFKTAMSISPATLTIDDDYPLGEYVYTGTLKGINGSVLPVTVTLIVE